MSTPDAAQGLAAALRRARLVAQQHMTDAEAAPGMTWSEETVTDNFLLAAMPFVAFEQFTKQKEEPEVGSDWIWWWVDQSGECFGMLVQAKRLRGNAGKPNNTVSFRYKGGEQHRALLNASDVLGVPAAYVVYMGDNAYRLPMTCRQADHTNDCERCSRWSVAVLSWLLADLSSASGRDGANTVINDGCPLEDVADPAGDAEPIPDLNLDKCDPELKHFLTLPQTGARLVAKTAFRKVSSARDGMYSLDTMEPATQFDGRVFEQVPDDAAHFARPYFDHVLRGLRRGLPAYAQDVLAGVPVPADIRQLVDGVAVFRC
jgi:hypothetical protein